MSFDPSEFGIPVGAGNEWGPNMYQCGYVQAKEVRKLAVGLDLASRNDYPAVAVVESIEEPEFDAAGAPVLDNLRQRLMPARYEVRNLRRLARGTSYLPIIAEVGRLMSHPDLAGATLCVDRNGVGDVFFDLLVAANFKNLMAVVTTGSTNREKRIDDGSGFSVGKQQLVNALQAVLQTGRLKVARDGEFTKEFMEELRAFSVTVSDRGHASYAAAGSAKDDLVMACAYGLFPLYPRKMGAWTSESLSL